MNILVLGATGGTGRQVVAEALARGHKVTAVIRRIDHGLPNHAHLRTLSLAHADVGALRGACSGHDIVISALGPNQKGAVTTCTDWAATTVEAMQLEGVRRLIAVSAYGANETRNNLSLYCTLLWGSVPHKMLDKETMEGIISASDLDWTIVRPPTLTKAGGRGTYRAGPELPISVISRIDRADLARFILDQADADGFVRQCVTVAA